MEGMNNSSNFKSTFSWEETKENLDDAILLSSNDEILSKSDDEIFYDTNEYSFSCESIITESDLSNISDGYESCPEFSENTDSTSLLSLPAPKYYFKNVPGSPKNLNKLQKQQNLKITKEEYRSDEDVPLRILLRRMFDEILGKCRKELNTCSVNKFENVVEINNNNVSNQSLKNNKLLENNNSYAKFTNLESSDSTILPSHSISNDWNQRKLITIWETSDENSDNSLYHQSILDSSKKYMGKLTNFPFRKPLQRINALLANSDMDDSASSECNSSIEIQMMSKEIFNKFDELKNNSSLNSTDQNGNSSFTNEKIVNANSNLNNLLKLTNRNIPTILITPPTPN